MNSIEIVILWECNLRHTHTCTCICTCFFRHCMGIVLYITCFTLYMLHCILCQCFTLCTSPCVFHLFHSCELLQALSLVELGRNREAFESLKNATRLFPQSASPYKHLSLLLSRQRRFEEVCTLCCVVVKHVCTYEHCLLVKLYRYVCTF